MAFQGQKRSGYCVACLVTSRLDYYNAIYVGLPMTSVWNLQLVQNVAARVVFGSRSLVSKEVTERSQELHLLDLLALGGHQCRAA